jgi:hypothetical protein
MDLLTIVRKTSGVRHAVFFFAVHQATDTNGRYAHQLGSWNRSVADAMHVSISLQPLSRFRTVVKKLLCQRPNVLFTLL